MIITPVQIGAILIGLVNLALYFFHFNDAVHQIKYLIWVFISLVVYLHDDLLVNIAGMLDQLPEDDEDESDKSSTD
jgi:hypothetical protein